MAVEHPEIEITQDVKDKLVEHAAEVVELLNHLTIMRPAAGVICAPTFENGLGMRAARLLHQLSLPIPDNLGEYRRGDGDLTKLREYLKSVQE